MASISKDSKGNRTIQFIAGDRRRRSIRLGKMNAKAVGTIKAKVEALNAAAISQTSWDAETAEWVGKLKPALHDKLAAAGLVPKRAQTEHATLAEFLNGFIASRSDVKRGTAAVYGHTRRCLIAYFGAGKALADITLADADDWRRWLATEEKVAGKIVRKKLAENTIRRRCGVARQFFRVAVRRRLIAVNPFGEMKNISVGANRSRDYFVSREETAKLLGACPDTQWRLIVALARYGGLRCPSEVQSLRWGDVNWADSRFTVSSIKTEHHEGKETRVVPLFPELRPYLEAAWDEAEPGTEFVITRYRDSGVNLRSRLLDIICTAGLKEWPKLFQNLRASRATELAAAHPAHVAAEWLGHSTLVAQRHYWQTTDADFDRAISTPDGALQNPVQSASESACKASQRKTAPRAIAVNCDGAPFSTAVQMSPAGLEPTTYGLKVRCSTD